MNNHSFIKLCCLPLLLGLASCSSQSSLKEQYNAERMLFKAAKLYQRLMINPRIAAQSDYNLTIAAYENILSTYSQPASNATIENIKKQSYVAIAELYLLQGEVQQAIQVYDRFLQLYPDDKSLGSFVHFANARSNETIFNLDKAISEYQILIDDLGQIADPLKPNPNVLNLPLRVARLKQYDQVSQDGPAEYQEALNYYDGIIQTWPNSPAEFMASYYQASIYLDQQNWYEAIAILNRLVREYPEREEIPTILLSIANLYMDGLNDLQMADHILDNMLTKYSEHNIAGYVRFAKARLLFKRKDLVKSREWLNQIIESYRNDQNLCASAQLTIASTYETEGNWERALVEYRWVQENYPTTSQGLFVPTYIAENYRKKGERTLTTNAFNDAVNHYSNIIKKYPKTALAASAQEYRIYTYVALEDWAKASEAALALKQIFPGSRTEINSSLYLGQIYEKMNDLDKAITVYESFAQAFPNHPIYPQIRDKIGSLRQRL